MGKEEICNMDCLHCVHPDCINERPMTRQARYYWRHRDRLLAEILFLSPTTFERRCVYLTGS